MDPIEKKIYSKLFIKVTRLTTVLYGTRTVYIWPTNSASPDTQ